LQASSVVIHSCFSVHTSEIEGNKSLSDKIVASTGMATSPSGDRKGLSAWFGSRKHRNGNGDTTKMDQWSHNDGAHQSLWNTDVAAAMGYGKK
jgi:hypothetical protein